MMAALSVVLFECYAELEVSSDLIFVLWDWLLSSLVDGAGSRSDASVLRMLAGMGTPKR